MRRVELHGTGVRTSAVGFGTAGFGARLGSRTRRRLLEAAFELGVTHFDTAPLYGDGTAEESVGLFLAGRRHLVTVTAKLGLLPPPGGVTRRLARAAARRLGTRVAEARRIGGAGARASFERTLRNLRTDYVDLLLLHESRSDDAGLDDLRAFVEAAVASGRARAGGVATDPGSAAALLTPSSVFPAVVQVTASLIDGNDVTAIGRGRALVLHSVLARDLGRVHAHLSASEERARAWRETSGVEVAAAELAPLLLRAAVEAHPGAVVLFASRDPHHIRANAAVDAVEPRAVEALWSVLRAMPK